MVEKKTEANEKICKMIKKQNADGYKSNGKIWT